MFEMLVILEMFPQNCHQLLGNMTKNQNFTYFIDEIFNCYHVTYNWRKSLEQHFHHGLTLQKCLNNLLITKLTLF